MHKLQLILFIPIAFLLASFMACNDDVENYSTNPGDVLTFSTDTVSFDIILSTVNTPTLGFMVYNQNNKPLLISSVELSGGGSSGFKINVDGVAGTRFEDVEIGAKDSIFVYVNVKLDENASVNPVLHTDNVIFTVNSVSEKIVLEAYGQDAYVWRGKIIESSETLPNDKPYLIYDSLEIKENATLTVQEGTVFYMHAKAKIYVRGTLKANGSKEKRIIFRGDRMDSDYMVNIPYDRAPGQWAGIRFAPTSFDNELKYVWIRNGSYGLDFELSNPEQLKLKMNNSIVTNVTGSLISSLNCRIEGENCEFSNSKGILMYLVGGNYNFTHCTMANYFASTEAWGTSNNPTLALTNQYYDTITKKYQPAPLLRADFANSIVFGPNSQAGINLAKDSVNNPATAYNYNFQNCLVLYSGTKKDQFNNCIFNQDPKFVNTSLVESGTDKSLAFDFRLDSISPARNVADPVIAQKIPYDLNGISRFQDQGPDMGAYEYEKVPDK